MAALAGLRGLGWPPLCVGLPGRTSPDEVTVYKAMGHAVEDLAAATLVLERARAEGVGGSVTL